MKRSMLLTFVILAAAAAQSADTTLRCKGKLVRAGMDANEVLKQCGNPDKTTIEKRPVFSGNRQTGTYEVEIWLYDRGTGQWPAELEVEAGVLKNIVYKK